MNELAITFRAKRTEFSGGFGYKVPKLTQSHVSVRDRDTLATLVVSAIGNVDHTMTVARLNRYCDGFQLPGVVWETGTAMTPVDPRWVIAPRGNGFMADVTITLPLGR